MHKFSNARQITLGHMSNRKEAVFAMLATLSIGAIWGGSIPYFGAQVSVFYFGKFCFPFHKMN